MFDIVEDPGTGTRFAVSLIVKLESSRLEVAAYAYFPKKERQDALVVVEESFTDACRTVFGVRIERFVFFAVLIAVPLELESLVADVRLRPSGIGSVRAGDRVVNLEKLA
jgi:hypothetical protein